MSLRVRLAFWYGALLSFVVIVLGLSAYLIHGSFLYEDIDRTLISTANHILVELRDQGMAGSRLADYPILAIEEFASPDVYVRIYDSDGQILTASTNASQQPALPPHDALTELHARLTPSLPLPPFRWGQAADEPDDGGLVTLRPPGIRHRTRLYVTSIRDAPANGLIGFIETGISLDRADRALSRLGMTMLLLGIGGILAATFGGLLLSGRALQPVAVITRTARAIALSKGFARRLPVDDARDELGQLAHTFNEMLASLHEAYSTQQRFVADASHELRAPLTVIQGNLELLQRVAGMPESERQETLHSLRYEVQRMSRLVDDLLTLARADAGDSLHWQQVELDRLVLEVHREARLLATGVKLSVTTLNQAAVQGDRDRLKQLLFILVDNALRYTPAGGRVTLSLEKEDHWAVLRISDTGIGIAEKDLPRLFERFYRGEQARSLSDGTGLGLAIARWIVERHGGQIAVESKPEQGSTFTVRLPVAEATTSA